MAEQEAVQLSRQGSTVSFHTVKLSGKARVSETLIPVMPEEDEKLGAYLEALIGFVGAKNFCVTLEKEVLKKAAIDAHIESLEADENGVQQVNPVKFTEEFAEYFAPAKRGGKVSDIQAKIIELNSSLCELFQKSGTETDPNKQNVLKTQMSRIVLETQKLQNILADKEKKKIEREQKKADAAEKKAA
jgi:hypothetical protein